jgi:methylmalonyl-CoA mutase cobalamin-binding subunit
LLFVLKKLGAQGFEELFSVDPDSEESPLTDMYAMTQDVVAAHRPMFTDATFRARVRGRKFVVASSDVHEHAAGALSQLLSEADASVVYLGAEQNPADLVAALRTSSADALLLSTHNGMALDYARQLKQLLETESMSVPVIMGGVLNQKVADQSLPVPVVDELKALGMHPAISLPGLLRMLPDRS